MPPFAPYVVEEIWAGARLAGRTGSATFPWPAWDDALASDDAVAIGVQKIRKARGDILLP